MVAKKEKNRKMNLTNDKKTQIREHAWHFIDKCTNAYFWPYPTHEAGSFVMAGCYHPGTVPSRHCEASLGWAWGHVRQPNSSETFGTDVQWQHHATGRGVEFSAQLKQQHSHIIPHVVYGRAFLRISLELHRVRIPWRARIWGSGGGAPSEGPGSRSSATICV